MQQGHLTDQDNISSRGLKTGVCVMSLKYNGRLRLVYGCYIKGLFMFALLLPIIRSVILFSSQKDNKSVENL
jgi:hypothetical protein